MSPEPNDLSSEERAKIAGRRGFLKRSVAGAAAPLVASSTPAQIPKMDENKLALLKELQSLLSAIGTTPIASHQLGDSNPPNFVYDMNQLYLEQQSRGAQKARETLPQLVAHFRKVKDSLGSAVLFPKPDVFKDLVDDNGVLHLAKLENKVNGVIENTTATLAEYGHKFPIAEKLFQRRTAAAQKFVTRMQEKYPHIPEKELREQLTKMKLSAPEGAEWSEYFSDPERLEEFTAPHDRDLSAKSKFYEEKNRAETKPYEEICREEKEHKSAELKKFTNRAVSHDEDYYYIEIGSPSAELYRTLRNVITLRSDDVYFPPEKEMFAAKLEDADGKASWVPVDIRVPPVGYAIRLSDALANRLSSIFNGTQNLQPRERQASEGVDDIAQYYRRRAEVGMHLADDLEQLKSLMAGKWVHRAKASADSSETLSR